MATKDLTTLTEVDGGGDLTVTTTKVDVVSQAGNVENYVYDDRGAAYYSGDFDHDFEFYLTTVNASSAGFLIGVSDQIGTLQNGTTLACAFNSSSLVPYLLDIDSGGNLDLAQTGSALSLATLYYCTFKRVGNALTWILYSDSGRSTIVQTITGTIVNTSQTYQYFYAQSAYNVSDGNTSTYYVQNIDYKEAAGGATALPFRMRY